MPRKIAQFSTVRDCGGFDFVAQPWIEQLQVRGFAACRRVAHGDALLLLGPPGVGKTHLAIAPGQAALREGYSVLCTSAPASSRPLHVPKDASRSGSPSTSSPSC